MDNLFCGKGVFVKHPTAYAMMWTLSYVRNTTLFYATLPMVLIDVNIFSLPEDKTERDHGKAQD